MGTRARDAQTGTASLGWHRVTARLRPGAAYLALQQCRPQILTAPPRLPEFHGDQETKAWLAAPAPKERETDSVPRDPRASPGWEA